MSAQTVTRDFYGIDVELAGEVLDGIQQVLYELEGYKVVDGENKLHNIQEKLEVDKTFGFSDIISNLNTANSTVAKVDAALRSISPSYVPWTTPYKPSFTETQIRTEKELRFILEGTQASDPELRASSIAALETYIGRYTFNEDLKQQITALISNAKTTKELDLAFTEVLGYKPIREMNILGALLILTGFMKSNGLTSVPAQDDLEENAPLMVKQAFEFLNTDEARKFGLGLDQIDGSPSSFQNGIDFFHSQISDAFALFSQPPGIRGTTYRRQIYDLLTVMIQADLFANDREQGEELDRLIEANGWDQFIPEDLLAAFKASILPPDHGRRVDLDGTVSTFSEFGDPGGLGDIRPMNESLRADDVPELLAKAVALTASEEIQHDEFLIAIDGNEVVIIFPGVTDLRTPEGIAAAIGLGEANPDTSRTVENATNSLNAIDPATNEYAQLAMAAINDLIAEGVIPQNANIVSVGHSYGAATALAFNKLASEQGLNVILSAAVGFSNDPLLHQVDSSVPTIVVENNLDVVVQGERAVQFGADVAMAYTASAGGSYPPISLPPDYYLEHLEDKQQRRDLPVISKEDYGYVTTTEFDTGGAPLWFVSGNLGVNGAGHAQENYSDSFIYEITDAASGTEVQSLLERFDGELHAIDVSPNY